MTKDIQSIFNDSSAVDSFIVSLEAYIIKSERGLRSDTTGLNTASSVSLVDLVSVGLDLVLQVVYQNQSYLIPSEQFHLFCEYLENDEYADDYDVEPPFLQDFLDEKEKKIFEHRSLLGASLLEACDNLRIIDGDEDVNSTVFTPTNLDPALDNDGERPTIAFFQGKVTKRMLTKDNENFAQENPVDGWILQFDKIFYIAPWNNVEALAQLIEIGADIEASKIAYLLQYPEDVLN